MLESCFGMRAHGTCKVFERIGIASAGVDLLRPDHIVTTISALSLSALSEALTLGNGSCGLGLAFDWP